MSTQKQLSPLQELGRTFFDDDWWPWWFGVVSVIGAFALALLTMLRG